MKRLLLIFLLSLSGFSATRMYMPATDSYSSLTPAFGGWTTTTGALRRQLTTFRSPEDTGATGSTITCNAAANSTCLDRQYISAPLSGAQTISGTFKGYWMIQELATTDDIDRWPVLIRVLQSDGTTYRCTLFTLADASPGVNEPASTALINRIIADGDSLTSCAAQDGDRIVVEVGYQVDSTGGTTPQGAARYGMSSSECPENETNTTACSPWIEFSQTLTFQIEKLHACVAANSTAAALTRTLTCSAPANAFFSCNISDDDNGTSTTVSSVAVAGAPTYSTAWTGLNRQFDNGLLNTEVWYAYTTSGFTSQVVTVTFSTSEVSAVACQPFLNVDATTPIPANAGDHSGAGVSKNSVTVTSSSNDKSVYVGAYTCGSNSARTAAAGTGYSKNGSVNDSVTTNSWAHVTIESKDVPVSPASNTTVSFGAYGCVSSGLEAEGIIGYELKLAGAGGGTPAAARRRMINDR